VRVVVVLGALERWRNKRNWGFGFAVTAFLGAFALRYALDDWLPPGVPFITFFPAVILAAFFAGLWPTVLLTFLSALTAWYFFLPPSPVVRSPRRRRVCACLLRDRRGDHDCPESCAERRH
jgi:K+-sensing histidine kinase KdpD